MKLRRFLPCLQPTQSGCLLGKAAKVTSTAIGAGVHWIKHIFDHDHGDAEPNIDKDPLAAFRAVLATLNLAALPEYAASIRRSQVSPQLHELTPWTFECTVKSRRPLHGSFNILFPITFGDGARWILKIPSDGHDEAWTESRARSLRSEAVTMRLLKEKGIPVPEVFAFDTSSENMLNCPFILMEFVDGKPLYEGWFNTTISTEEKEVFRKKCLQNLASIMAQVSSKSYSQAGSPTYDQDGNIDTFGPLRVYDGPAMHKNLMGLGSGRGSAYSPETYCEIGPFDSAQSYLLSMLDRHSTPDNKMCHGENELLRLFIEWASQQNPRKDDFVLTHPDLDLQNIIVDTLGNIRALIDWDGVMTTPRFVGCSFPKWLTNDWDPDNYDYLSGMSGSSSCEQDHSPEQSTKYRKMYAQFFEEALMRSTSDEASASLSSNMLRRSVLIESLNKATQDPDSKTLILFKIFDLVGQITSQESFSTACKDTADVSNRLIPLDNENKSMQPGSDSASDGSVSTRTTSTDRDSDKEGFLPHSAYSTPRSEGISDLDERRSPKSKRIVIGSGEEIVSTTASAQPDQGSGGALLPLSRNDLTKYGKSSRVHHMLRNFSKSMNSALGRQPRLIFQRSGPTGLSVVVENTLFDIVNPGRCGADSHSLDHESGCDSVSAAKTIMGNSPAPQSTQCLGEGNSSLDEILYADPLTGSSKVLGPLFFNTGDLGSSSMSEEGIQQVRVFTSSPQPPKRDQGVCSSKDNQNSGQRPVNRKWYKAGFCRRLTEKLAFPCQSPDFDTSTLPCKEIRNDHSSTVVRSRKKRIAAWVKSAMGKAHSSDTASSASDPSSPTLPNNSRRPEHSNGSLQASGTSAWADEGERSLEDSVVEDEEDVESCLSADRYAGLRVYDLENLEPVSEDLLSDEGFSTVDVFEALADASLDRARMQRLKLGFLTLLHSL